MYYNNCIISGDFIDEMDWVNYKKKVLKNKKQKSKTGIKQIKNIDPR